MQVNFVTAELDVPPATRVEGGQVPRSRAILVRKTLLNKPQALISTSNQPFMLTTLESTSQCLEGKLPRNRTISCGQEKRETVCLNRAVPALTWCLRCRCPPRPQHGHDVIKLVEPMRPERHLLRPMPLTSSEIGSLASTRSCGREAIWTGHWTRDTKLAT